MERTVRDSFSNLRFVIDLHFVYNDFVVKCPKYFVSWEVDFEGNVR